ncbi:MAG: hypothetical protein Q9163_002834 [Psora crenata]
MTFSNANDHKVTASFEELPPKRIQALLEDHTSEDESASDGRGGVNISSRALSGEVDGFKINEEFARRFEHNKKREELHRLQEKYGITSKSISTNGEPAGVTGEYDGSSSSSESEEEDDEGVLASEALDAQIQETLEAIRKKDPRVYDKNVTFYAAPDEDAGASTDDQPKQPKPMYLNDYHRRNLLEGGSGEPEDSVPPTYAKEQDYLKRNLVKEIHAAAADQIEGATASDNEGDGFLVAKPSTGVVADAKTRPKRIMDELDVENADRDPEAYLSNFMAARAWVPTEGSRFQPFESDDEEEDRRADEFEEAYNLRFEDPAKSNEKLMSHARDAAAKYSVRKESLNPRKRAREAERGNKEAAKRIREEEKARLRKLKVADAEAKIQKIREAAGVHGKSIDDGDWLAFLEEGWDDARWEEEMKKRFGDKYYAGHGSDGEKEGIMGRKKLKKPKWDEDIEIDDIVPEFETKDSPRPQFEFSDDPADEDGAFINTADTRPKKRKQKRGQEQERKGARQERQDIERLVDAQIDVEETLSSFGRKHTGQFRYRDTSPIAFGLTAQDILMASDSQLNQYAGLKKMAAFRDPEKKKKDKKHLGKKARLRQWRKDTFGDEHGPKQTLADMLAGQESHKQFLSPRKRKTKERNTGDIREAKTSEQIDK